MEIIKQLVTPDFALDLLQSNVSNRRINEYVVTRYSNDMKEGRWKTDTVEVLKVSKSGKLLDGQHRLSAVVKSKTPVFFHIAYGLDDCIFDVLDTGKTRNATDVFKIKGIKNECTIPSIIQTCNFFNAGIKPDGVQKSKRDTNNMLIEQYYEDEEFWQYVAKKTMPWYRSFAKILSQSVLGGLFACLYKINPEKAEDFLNQLTTGIDIKNDTISLLRTKLMQDKMAPRKMPLSMKYALIIKTWNMYIQNKSVKLLKFDTVTEKYPTILHF